MLVKIYVKIWSFNSSSRVCCVFAKTTSNRHFSNWLKNWVHTHEIEMEAGYEYIQCLFLNPIVKVTDGNFPSALPIVWLCKNTKRRSIEDDRRSYFCINQNKNIDNYRLILYFSKSFQLNHLSINYGPTSVLNVFTHVVLNSTQNFWSY